MQAGKTRSSQTRIIGPNSRPTAPVPSRCSRNRPTMITAVTGTTSPATDGAATLTPSIAERTEIAGVITLSPKNGAAPKIPSAASATARDSLPPDQGDQRHDPALAVIVGAHHQQHVGDGDHHRPEDQRADPENALLGHRDRMGSPGLKTAWMAYSGLVPISRRQLREHQPRESPGPWHASRSQYSAAPEVTAVSSRRPAGETADHRLGSRDAGSQPMAGGAAVGGLGGLQGVR
jgi:hypothetical protein